MREVASRELELAAKSEREHLVEFRQGNAEARETAFEAIFRLHQRAVRGWILRIVRNPAAADELTIETFWRIYRARDRFEPSRGFEPWARRIATRTALDWLRAQKPEYSVANEFFADLPSPGGRPDPAVLAEIRHKTAIAFGRLRPGLRIAATLAVIEERPHKEVAEALGISVMAVKLRVFRALRLLRKDLREQGITP
jgi:RNA polymerase sigma-70 factor (ECF subfamily)